MRTYGRQPAPAIKNFSYVTKQAVETGGGCARQGATQK